MMNVEIDDRDALDTRFLQGSLGGNGYVVEQAETHDSICFGMVPGRPDQGKADSQGPGHNPSGQLHPVSCGQSGHLERIGAGVGVGIKAGVRLPHRFAERLHKFVAVNLSGEVQRHHFSENLLQTISSLELIQHRHDRFQTLGALRVAGGVSVIQKAGIEGVAQA